MVILYTLYLTFVIFVPFLHCITWLWNCYNSVCQNLDCSCSSFFFQAASVSLYKFKRRLPKLMPFFLCNVYLSVALLKWNCPKFYGITCLWNRNCHNSVKIWGVAVLLFFFSGSKCFIVYKFKRRVPKLMPFFYAMCIFLLHCEKIYLPWLFCFSTITSLSVFLLCGSCFCVKFTLQYEPPPSSVRGEIFVQSVSHHFFFVLYHRPPMMITV